MTCESQRHVDLAAFVAAPRDEAFAEFREHYPSCAACSAALAEWLPLEETLREVADAHPDDDALLGFATGETGADAERVAAHVERCAECRDALAAFRAVQGAGAVAPAPSAAEERAHRAWRLSPRTLALAAAAALLAAWLLPTVFEALAPPAPDAPRVAETPGPEPAPVPKEPVPSPEPPTRVASEPSAPSEPPAPAPQPEETPRTAPPAQERVAIGPPAPRRADLPDTGRAVQEYLATLGSAGVEYRAAPGLPAGRIGAGARSAVEALGIVPLVPKAVALSDFPSPTLRWYQKAALVGDLILTVSDPLAMRDLASHRIAGPVAKGHHSVSLAQLGVSLPRGQDVQWTLTLEAEPGAAAGAILRHVPAPALLTSGDSAAARLRALAAAGYWYDALDLLLASIARSPEDASLRDAFAALVASQGLDVPAP